MRNTFRNQRGITLAILVITVILLLLLSTVSINYSLDAIDHSRFMAIHSEMQIIQEQVNLYNLEGKEIKGEALNTDQTNVLEWKVQDENARSTYYYFSAEDLRYILDNDSIEGDYLISIQYRDIIGLTQIKNQGKIYISYRLEDISQGFNVEYSQAIAKLSQKVSIGDKVNYDPTLGGNATSANTTYTSEAGTATSHGNGTSSQKFSAVNYQNAGGEWRVLTIDGDSVVLISDLIYQDSGSVMGNAGLSLSNGVGYLWAEQEIHNICAIYGHGKGADTTKTITYYYGGPTDQDSSATGEYALTGAEAQQGRKATIDLNSGGRGLTIDDINEICGVSSTYDADYYNGTVPKSAKNAKYYPTLSGDSSTGLSAVQTGFSGSYYYTFYKYTIESANKDSVDKEMQNNMLKLDTAYWLASRSLTAENQNTTYFAIRRIDESNLLTRNTTLETTSENYYLYTRTWPIRAVVTLDANLMTPDSSYNASTGWNITY